MRESTIRCPLRRELAVAAVLAALPSVAPADAGDVVNYSVGTTVTQDSNVYRLAPGVDPQTTIGSSNTSDIYTTTTVGVVADKEIGLQRLKLDMQLNKARYRRFTSLDNDGHNISGNWAWAVGSRLHGDLSISSKKALSSFTHLESTTPNINTVNNGGGSLYLKLAADWEAFGAASKEDSANSSVEQQSASYLTRSTTAGLRYTSPAGHQLTLSRRLVRSAAQIRRDDVDLSGTWAFSGITQLSAGLGHVVRHDESGATADAGGTTGNMTVRWAPTGKTLVNLAARQEVAADVSSFSTTTLVSSVLLDASWQVTAKTSLQFLRVQSVTSYANDPTAGTNQREDRLHSTGLILSYRPFRALSLNFSLRDEVRDSNQPTYSYRDRQGTATAQFAF